MTMTITLTQPPAYDASAWSKKLYPQSPMWYTGTKFDFVLTNELIEVLDASTVRILGRELPTVDGVSGINFDRRDPNHPLHFMLNAQKLSFIFSIWADRVSIEVHKAFTTADYTTMWPATEGELRTALATVVQCVTGVPIGMIDSGA